jgi:hypothetical protein
MLATIRLTGIGRPYNILDCMACWRMWLLRSVRWASFAFQGNTPQYSRITRQSSDSDADMVIDPDHLLLVRRELAG